MSKCPVPKKPENALKDSMSNILYSDNIRFDTASGGGDATNPLKKLFKMLAGTVHKHSRRSLHSQKRFERITYKQCLQSTTVRLQKNYMMNAILIVATQHTC